MAKNLMICKNSTAALRLNESESKSGSYILQGVFATLDQKNRNERIYHKNEYLKHLQYLRDDLRKGEPLLGELDHPDDRFEVKLKEASHQILDIWYDEATNTIQGKIRLLDTPNGIIAQSMVDQGIPLHISSRAAGVVNSDSSVTIQQIYTYDLVAKPGFAEAVLHRVNESTGGNKYTKDVYAFLQSTENNGLKNIAGRYGMMNEDMDIKEVASDVKLRREAKEICKTTDNNNMSKINENVLDADQLKREYKIVFSISLSDFDERLSDFVNQQSSNENVTILIADGRIIFGTNDEKYYMSVPVGADVIEFIQGAPLAAEAKDEDDVDNDEKNDDIDNNNDDKKDDNGDDDDPGVEILDVRVETDADNKEEDEDSDSDEDEKEDDDNDDEKDDEKTDECDTNECGDGGCGKKDMSEKKSKPDPKKEMLTDCSDIKEKREKLTDKLDDLIDAIKSKSEKKKTDESVTISKYPISSLLTQDNFQKFMTLDESQKGKVVDYLKDNGIVSQRMINESWANGINYENEKEIWLVNAPAEYARMFENASEDVKRSIRNTAAYVLFENQYDINRFWEGTGLMESTERSLMHEKFINNVPKITPVKESVDLPYGSDFIKAVTEMACEYND